LEFRDIGRTGLRSTILGFGAMRIPDSPPDEAIATVRRAVELGINYIETSPGYGDSEVHIGQALEGVDKSDLIISTKSHVGGDKTAWAVRRKMERSLERLKVNHLRFYQMWGINNLDLFAEVTKPGGPLEGARQGRAEGLIDHIGFTTHAQPEEIITMLESGEFESVSLLHNIIDRRALPAIQRAGELGIGVVHMTPLSQGMLANPSPTLCEAYAPFTPREIALRYLASLLQTSTIIAGPKNRIELEQNVMAMEAFAGWTEQHQEAFLHAEGYYDRLGPDYCTLCRECMPCPENVNIPELLRLNNLLVAFELESYCRDRYAFMGNGGTWFPGVKADQCTKCGICEERCPKKLRVIELLDGLHDRLYAGDRGRLSSDD